ncbi:SusC/RagA family TonB-linked outer membrane protein [Hymenobacter sp. GOD-10R]|uniref:SusC/RagA family TonB-linked outer membrane protein n=1 Tax=Hymenobacter sp. GOD-10R TaxID=3093922 RepID=UPI002D7906A4|nr:SusC/RagA family TonB-linked outer membrane protein [Hymenobacter sp. GOD-10R]WRQ29781.1 SusC/RagA family TonB-linked outer membrane protein [Hymenobacter sp. GOD-10R]
MKRILFWFIVLTFSLLRQAAAQEKGISGRVTDRATGQGLPGVTVLVKGTTVGASTNSEGTYSLNAPASATTLTFSSIGFVTLERAIGNATTVDVALAADNRQLDEVVVTGLATTIKRSNLANAVTTVSAKDLYGSTRPVTVDAALNGKIVGANIAQTSGAPGGGVSIQLRGISTISGSSQPLYIIDGVYAVSDEVGNGAGGTAFTGAASATGRTNQDNGTNRLSDLNPNDIESIEVLKGPSAAAIYGTRANAGVIIIKTKRGVAGQTRVSVSQDLGFTQARHLLGLSDDPWTAEKIDRVNLYSAARAQQEKQKLAAAQASGKLYNYEKEIFGNTGFLRNTNVSVSGGSDRTKFYVSGSTTKEDGIVKNTDYSRSSIRANVDQKIGKLIDLGISSGYNRSKNRRGFSGNDNNGISLAYSLTQIPTYAELHKDPVTGLYPNSDYTGDNPLAIVERAVNEETTNRVTQAANATVHLIEKEKSSLRFAAQGGVDFASSTALLALPSDLQSQASSANPGAVRIAKNEFFNYNLQGFLIYNFTLGQNVNLTSQVGLVRLGLNSNLSYQQGQNLVPGPLLPNRGSLVTQDVQLTDQADVGYVAQQEANFRDQIIATAGIRFDKSSRNGDPNKLYAFPKGSLAVNLAKFDFWSVEKVNLVKLRAAYGQTGGPAFFGGTFSPLTSISIGNRPGFTPSNVVGNLAIGPERATELETGIDIGLLNGRVNIEATFYNKKIKDIVNTYVTAPSTGVTSIRAFPVGDLRNNGLELSLGVVPFQSENFTWSSNNLFWYNRSKVTRIIVPAFSASSGFGSTYGQTYFALNDSPSHWYGTPVSAADNPGTPSNLTGYGNAQPKFQMSFQNTFTLFKNLELSFLLAWKKDSYNSNLTYAQTDVYGTSKDWSEPSGQTGDAGTELNKGEYRQLRGTASSSVFIENSSYVRLREASIYYSLPVNLRTSLFKDYVRNIRVGVSGNNLLTFTNYSGYDPEVSNFGQTSTAAQVDLLPYPATRRVFFHLNLDF